MKRRGKEGNIIITNMTPAHTRFAIPNNTELPVIVIRALKPAEVRADTEQFFILRA